MRPSGFFSWSHQGIDSIVTRAQVDPFYECWHVKLCKVCVCRSSSLRDLESWEKSITHRCHCLKKTARKKVANIIKLVWQVRLYFENPQTLCHHVFWFDRTFAWARIPLTMSVNSQFVNVITSSSDFNSKWNTTCRAKNRVVCKSKILFEICRLFLTV
jgi:hypothetical protein